MSAEMLEESLRSRLIDAAPFRAVLASRPDPYPDLVLAFAGANPSDVAHARSIAARATARGLAVQGCPAHSLLGWLFDQGRLAPFLETALGQPLEGPSTA